MSILRKLNDPRPWISQRQKNKKIHKKVKSCPRVKSSSLSPAEQAVKRHKRQNIDQRKGPVTASPTRPRGSVKGKVPFTPVISSPPRPMARNSPSPTPLRDRRNGRLSVRTFRRHAQRKVYWSPVGHRKMSPQEISGYWSGKPGPFLYIPHYSRPRPQKATTETDRARYEASFARSGPRKVIERFSDHAAQSTNPGSSGTDTVPSPLKDSRRQKTSSMQAVVYQGWMQAGRRQGAGKLLVPWAPHPLTDSEGWSHGYRFGIQSEAPPRPRGFVSASSLAFSPPPNLSARVRAEQRQDALLQVLFEKTEGFPTPSPETRPVDEFWVRTFGPRCTVEDDILYHFTFEGSLAIVPVVPRHLRGGSDARGPSCEWWPALHSGHRELHPSNYWWPYMREDIVYYMDNCVRCVRRSQRRLARVIPLRKPQTVAFIEEMRAAELFRVASTPRFPGGGDDVTTWQRGDIVYFKPGVRTRLALPLRGAWEFVRFSGVTVLLYRSHPLFDHGQRVATHPGNLTKTRVPPEVMGREQKPLPRMMPAQRFANTFDMIRQHAQLTMEARARKRAQLATTSSDPQSVTCNLDHEADEVIKEAESTSTINEVRCYVGAGYPRLSSGPRPLQRNRQLGEKDGRVDEIQILRRVRLN